MILAVNVGLWVGVMFLFVCLCTVFSIWLGRPIDIKKEKEKDLRKLDRKIKRRRKLGP